jgi:hypothetical protein
MEESSPGRKAVPKARKRQELSSGITLMTRVYEHADLQRGDLGTYQELHPERA